MKTIRVLVVDDSAFMRHTISRHLSAAAGIEVVGAARDGVEALERVAELRPDVVTLDVEMPRMDGLEALRRLMADHPLPVVMVSSLTQEGAETTIRALELGAVDFVPKPSGSDSPDLYRVKGAIIDAVLRAATSRVRPARLPVIPVALTSRPTTGGRAALAERLVVIGCSTGGPRALYHVIPALPAALPVAVLVVQHMPAGFTRSLAKRLDELSMVSVREAANGDELRPGVVLVAPGDYHLVTKDRHRVELSTAPREHGVRPSVDVTLRSVAAVFGGDAVVAILTGMGLDGGSGAAEVRERGGYIIAEDESTCVVYGMPRAVQELAGVDEIAPLPSVARAIVAAVERRSSRSAYARTAG